MGLSRKLIFPAGACSTNQTSKWEKQKNAKQMHNHEAVMGFTVTLEDRRGEQTEQKVGREESEAWQTQQPES